MATSVLKLGDIFGKIFIIASVLGVYSLLLCRLLEFNVQSRGTSQGVLYLQGVLCREPYLSVCSLKAA